MEIISSKLKVVQRQFDVHSENARQCALKLKAIKQSVDAMQREYDELHIAFIAPQHMLSTLEDTFKRNHLLSMSESELIDFESRINELKCAEFKFVNASIYDEGEMEEILRQKLEKETEKMRMSLLRDKQETNKEFCTLMALLLILLFVFIVVIALKAKQLFCGSDDIDIMDGIKEHSEL